MSAHDARRGARYIGQDRIKRLAIPPALDIQHARCLERHAIRGQPESGKIFLDTLQSPFVNIQRSQLQVRQLEQMRGFPARGRARVEHAHAITHPQQWRGDLRASVLDRPLPFVKSRQLMGWTGRRQHDA